MKSPRLSLKKERLDVHEAMIRSHLVPTLEGWTLASITPSPHKTKNYDYVLSLTRGNLSRRLLIECKTDTYENAELPVELWANIPRENILPQVLVWPKGEGVKERRARHEYITSHIRSLARWHYQSGGTAMDTADWERGLALVNLPEILASAEAHQHITSYVKTEEEVWYGIDTSKLQGRISSHYPMYSGIIGRNEGHGSDWYSMCAKVVPSRDAGIWLTDCYSIPVSAGVMRPSMMVPFDAEACR